MENQKCEKFIQTLRFNQPQDSCLKCGRTELAHNQVITKQKIKIFFQGKFYEFDNWEKAKEKGFYLY